MEEKRLLLGEKLVTKNIITQEQLEQAFEESQRTGIKIGDVLTRNGFAKEEEVVNALCEQLDFAFIDVSTYQCDTVSLAFIPQDVAMKLQAVAVYKIADTLTVAMVDPLNLDAVDEIERVTKMTVNPVFGTSTGIGIALEKYYGSAFSSQKKEEDSAVDTQELRQDSSIPSLDEEAARAPVVKLVKEIIDGAIRAGASDVHLEPLEHGLRWRYRIDGILQKPLSVAQEFHAAVISRIKIMANIDIAEKRLPQDGRIQMTINQKEVDLRVATFPTIYGENVAIRVLDKSGGILELEQLGMEGDLLNQTKKIIRKAHGLILVTGPTGSGKSTTLYSMLGTVKDLQKNIITLEDPVEYSIEGIQQSQVNVKAGLNFATGLRAIVRMDPDIIMIGEIRDRETAEIAIHAALTGHLVFSTLHTNDAPSTAARLIDMGVEPYLLSSSLSAIIAQRLVRQLCEKCKKAYQPSSEDCVRLGLADDAMYRDMTLYEKTGCSACRQTGFKGRIGLYELFIPTDASKQLITQKASANSISESAQASGMRTILSDGVNKVMAGHTSISEVLRVIQEA